MNTLIDLLRGFTIRTRMIGAIALVLLLLAGVGAGGLVTQQRLVAANAELADRVVAELSTLGELRSAMGDLRRYEKDMLLSYENPEAAAKYHASWGATYAKTLKLVDSMQEGRKDSDNAALRDLRKDLDGYAKGAEPVFRQVLASGYDNAAAANKLLDVKAKGAVLGQMYGYAVKETNNEAARDASAFLFDAADGNVAYGAPLGGFALVGLNEDGFYGYGATYGA